MSGCTAPPSQVLSQVSVRGCLPSSWTLGCLPSSCTLTCALYIFLYDVIINHQVNQPNRLAEGGTPFSSPPTPQRQHQSQQSHHHHHHQRYPSAPGGGSASTPSRQAYQHQHHQHHQKNSPLTPRSKQRKRVQPRKVAAGATAAVGAAAEDELSELELAKHPGILKIVAAMNSQGIVPGARMSVIGMRHTSLPLLFPHFRLPSLSASIHPSAPLSPLYTVGLKDCVKVCSTTSGSSRSQPSAIGADTCARSNLMTSSVPTQNRPVVG